ncbi:putative oxidoreductase [Aeromonas sp. RU39B]|jgi:putative oxidoreductase|uniref:DoxX family protein n=1 Tax=Aeromonas sp. RU39B TaxID=1907416 RepID=UPI00095598BD|nr:DoxX family protein [Aeromonas sp. RU39B]SIR20695.1 putative oxidoreductase [Aeromonas sp. RU39B]
MLTLLRQCNALLDKPDLAKLLLRITLGGLLFFHGWHKVLAGTGAIQGMLEAQGVPGFIGYGVLIGEVVAPILLVLGILCRLSALSIFFTMIVAWLLVGTGKTFTLTPVGAWGIEDLVYYAMAALTVMLLGCGRYSVMSNPEWR